MVELLGMKMHENATRPGLYRVFHEQLMCQTRITRQCNASLFIQGVSWTTEVPYTKFASQSDAPSLYWMFHDGGTARHEIAWQCNASSFIPGVSMHDGTARHELVSTRIYGYLDKLNARIAGLNADRITIVYRIPYVRSEKWCCVYLCEYSNSRVPWQDFHDIWKLDQE